MIIVPVSVRTYKVKVSVVNDTVSVVIVPSAITAALVSSMITAALTKENIPGLKLTDLPEFTDIQTPALQSDAVTGGEIPATIYDWFKSVYASLVDKSVKSWITGLVTFVKSLTETANAAGSLAAQASQAINEHAQATNNPHATNVTQEFADTQITPLAVEATYTPTVWSYLVGLFTSVPKSILQHLVKLWGVVKDLATRVGLLEDNSYLDRFKVPTNHLRSGEYFNSAITSGASAGTVALAANTIIMTPIVVSDDIEVEALYSRVCVTTDGHFVMGIYEGNSFYPYSLIWQSESISQSVSGVKGSLTTNVVLRKNKLYWIAYLSDNNVWNNIL